MGITDERIRMPTIHERFYGDADPTWLMGKGANERPALTAEEAYP